MSNFIRLLRNGTLYADRVTAKTKLEEQLAKLQDGEICLASYGASWEAAKTILGVVRTKGATPSYTIFDNEDIDNEDIDGIMAKIQQLDATVRGNLTEGDVIQTGKHVGVKVVEEDGKLTGVTVVESDIASAKLLGTKDDTKDADTAFGRIKKEAENRDAAITAAVNALDSSVAATAESNNQYSVLTGVTQVDGKLTGKTEVTLAAVAKTGSAADVAKAVIPNDGTYATVEGENVSEQIASIAKTIKGITTANSNAFKYITVKLTDEEVAALKDSNVKEAYKVVAYIGNDYKTATTKETVGEVIKIYKDATIHKIYLGNAGDTIDATTGVITSQTTPEPSEETSSLNYAYIKADGKYAMASIPVGNFLRESEFKNGLHVNENGEVSVKVDEASEGFLTVGEAGVKVSGVQDAITTAIGKLNTTVESTGDGKVSVTVTEANGVITGVTVATPGLASEADVVKEVTVNGINADVASNKATVTIDGTDIAVADSTETYETTVYSAPFEGKVGTNHIATGDTVAAAFKKTENTISVLADEVIANEKVTTTAVSKLAESVGGVTNTDGVIKYTPKTNANYIGEATSVHDATVKLDAAIKNVASSGLTSVAGSQAITVSENNTVSLKLDGIKTDNALKINTDGLYLSNVWDCGEY